MYSSFLGKEPTSICANETIARLRESAELANCWHAKLLVQLCPFSPDAEPVVMDAFSLVDEDTAPSKKKDMSSFDPKNNQYCASWAYQPSPSTVYFFPSQYKPSDPKSWPLLCHHIQRSGYAHGTQLVCCKTAGAKGNRYELACFRSQLSGASVLAADRSSEDGASDESLNGSPDGSSDGASDGASTNFASYGLKFPAKMKSSSRHVLTGDSKTVILE